MRRFFLPVLCPALLLMSGCTAKDASWGAQTMLLPSFERIGTAAYDAAADPLTWAPLSMALGFRIGDHDARTVRWAGEHTPLFDSRDNALDTSDRLKSLSEANYWLSAFAAQTRTGTDGLTDRAGAIALGWGLMALNARMTDSLKTAIGRERPDGSNRRSFPSGHTTKAVVAATLSARNIEHAALPSTGKRMWQGAAYGTAALTGWARVEAGVHYPSDVLASFALGHCLGAFLNDAFIAPAYRGDAQISAGSDGTGVTLTLHYRW